jgi:thiol-disulfide isomerase/thioredoxin
MMKKFAVFCVLAWCSSSAFNQAIPAVRIKDIVNYYTRGNDSIYVINFWATFCKPCVAEIPHLQSITKKYAGSKVKLLLVSLDLPSYYPVRIEKFAKSNRFYADIQWLNETDADYFCPLIDKRWSGSIPATLIVNEKKGYKKFVEDEMTAGEFEKELQLAL